MRHGAAESRRSIQHGRAFQNLRLPIDVELVYCAPLFARAGVVELVDTGDSKSPALKSVPVQVRPSVPTDKQNGLKSSQGPPRLAFKPKNLATPLSSDDWVIEEKE